MILLDTNIVSKVMRAIPDSQVKAWFEAQGDIELVMTAVTVGELHYGVAIMPEGKRRDDVTRRMDQTLEHSFENAILPYDSIPVRIFGQLNSALRQTGTPTGMADAMIAAIALSHDAVVATRNVKHFEPCGVKIVNPFEGASSVSAWR